MLQGQPWHAAATAAGLCVSRATAYRLLQRVRTEGEAALTDGRHGHPIKLRAPLRHWLEEFWRDQPQATCRKTQEALKARFGIEVSQSHLSRVRTALGVTSHLQGTGEKGGARGVPGANLAGGSRESVAARGGPGDGIA